MSRTRRVALDVVHLAARQPTMHGLIEVDVTRARERMRSAGDRPTVTAFVVATLGRAVRDVPAVNVRRAGRRVVHISAVDIVVTVERLVDGELVPVPFVVHDADAKSVADVTRELRAYRSTPLDGPEPAPARSMVAALRPLARRAGAVVVGRFPRTAARFGPPVGVSSLGMFGAGWGIPLSPMTVMITIGGTTMRPVLANGEIANHEFLPLTLSFDHTVIDGAPAARFASVFRGLLEAAAIFDEARHETLVPG